MLIRIKFEILRKIFFQLSAIDNCNLSGDCESLRLVLACDWPESDPATLGGTTVGVAWAVTIDPVELWLVSSVQVGELVGGRGSGSRTQHKSRKRKQHNIRDK